MGHIELKIRFPCGYEVEMVARSIWLHGYYDETKLPLCPLHDKDCLTKIKSRSGK